MSRLTIAPVLFTLGFLPACAAEVDDGDLGDYEGLQTQVTDAEGPAQGEDVLATRAAVDLEDDDFEEPDADLGELAGAQPDPTVVAGPMLPAPRLLCGTKHCYEGGDARRPLRGRDAVRNALLPRRGLPRQGDVLLPHRL